MTTHIFTVTDEKKFKGDWANAVAVGNALAAEIGTDKVNIINLDGDDAAKIDDLLFSMNTEEPIYIVTAGEAHADFLAGIQGTHITKILSSHQMSDTIRSVAEHFNFVALPKHAIKQDEKLDMEKDGVSVIETLGVPHLVTAETLTAAYEKRMAFDASEKCMPIDAKFRDMIAKLVQNSDGMGNFASIDLLVLSGDAPDAQGQMRYFLPSEAANIAVRAMANAKENFGYLAITNGPRTGKHDPITGEPTAAHRGDTEIDPVTRAARQALLDIGFKEGEDFDVWDFRFLDKGVDSAYQALLAAAMRTQGSVYMPGESTSMVTEAADVLKRVFTIYGARSMSRAHSAHMASVYEAGQANVLTRKGHMVWARKLPEGQEVFATDSQRIARAVFAPR